MGDFVGDRSIFRVIVTVIRRFNLFCIAHWQGYKLAPPGPNQERQEDPGMGDFGGDGSFDGVIVGVSRRLNLFRIPRDRGYSWDHPEASLTPSGLSGMSERPQDG